MQRKMRLPIGAIIIVFVVILSTLSLINLNVALKQEVMYVKDGFDNNIRIAVETLISTLEINRKMYLDGDISEETAIENAKKLVRDTRYNSAPDKIDDGYFWADMSDGYCVVHYNPANEGTMRWDVQDQEGTYLIRNFIARGNEGGGFSDFYFGKPGDESGSYQKRGYTLIYEPYGWYISTGNYYEDIDKTVADIERIKRTDFIITLVASIIISIVGLLLSREHKKMERKTAHHSELIGITNRVASALLTPVSEDIFKESLMGCMKLIGGNMNADRVQIWQNETIGGILHYTLKHNWDNTVSDSNPIPIGTRLKYSKSWQGLLADGGTINGPVSKLETEDREAMESIGLKSTLTIPLFSHGEFWGIVCIDDCKQERVFPDDEVNMLTSSGLMLVNAIIRHEQSIQLNKMNEKLTDALEEATEANKAKSAFLSTMSHEIRTPMNAILGITDIQLQSENMDGNIRVGLEKIHASGNMLLGIINDILDLSKIEAGKLELIEANYELAGLIGDTAQLNMMRIGSKPIEFLLNVDENLPVKMLGDELRVKQILNNLLSNAFKYTDEGKVTLSVSFDDGKNDGEITLVVSVSDTGQGMSKEQVEKLFDEYARFNMEANRTTEGTGLGMSITRNLIRMMDGEIIIESEPGKGSVFVVRLSQGRVGEDVLGKETADNLQQFRMDRRSQMKNFQFTHEPMPYGKVLVVDDVETNVYVAQGLMTPYGLSIDTASSGYEAIDKVKAGNEYDIIFMDHMMPKMDGIEATQLIRGMGYSHPIVALTANAVVGQADIFIANGFTDFISKPIDVRQLNAVLNKLIRDKQPPEVLEAARNAAGHGIPDTPSSPNGTSSIDPRFAEIFVRDAAKALNTLDTITKNNSYEEDMRTYVINVHGIKSALANIGEADLSAVAQKLEAAGRDGNLKLAESDTPGFLISLQEVIDRLTPEEDETAGEQTAENTELLKEKLRVIKDACDEYDGNTADAALAELREKVWTAAEKELLGKLAELLLYSDFDEAKNAIDDFLAD
ncbi:MAG: cache domain-containing protein [Oscillospiraceae bacterium]|nr:cache domain-containing protein [Oscillospiraceae bacterium]